MKTLTKEFGVLSTTGTAGVWTITVDETANGWESIDVNTFVNRTYFDLAGMSMDDKTLFFTGATTQNAKPPATIPATPGNRAFVHDIMTNKPLSDAEVGRILNNGNMVGSDLTFDQTIYMRHQIFNTDLDNQASGIMIPIFDSQMGSLEPTASDRVYVTRAVQFSGADGNYFTYPVRYILRAEAKEEPEYEYLMRLKRSYELQNEPDRD